MSEMRHRIGGKSQDIGMSELQNKDNAVEMPELQKGDNGQNRGEFRKCEMQKMPGNGYYIPGKALLEGNHGVIGCLDWIIF